MQRIKYFRRRLPSHFEQTFQYFYPPKVTPSEEVKRPKGKGWKAVYEKDTDKTLVKTKEHC